MKNFLLSFLIFFTIGLTNCSLPLQVEMTNLERVSFDDLKLQPTHDLYNYRHDILRQKQWVGNEICGYQENMPYHPLGMELGNGLFMDLNYNLSLDLTSVLTLPESGAFVLNRKDYRRPELERQVRVSKEQVCYDEIHFLSKETKRVCRDITYNGELIEVKQDRLGNFSIQQQGERFSLIDDRGRITSHIRPKGEGIYVDDLRSPRYDFQQVENEILLGRYRITLSPKRDEIQIYQRDAKRERLIKKIVKTQGYLYILDAKNRGEVVQIDKDQLRIKSGEQQFIELALVAD